MTPLIPSSCLHSHHLKILALDVGPRWLWSRSQPRSQIPVTRTTIHLAQIHGRNKGVKLRARRNSPWRRKCNRRGLEKVGLDKATGFW